MIQGRCLEEGQVLRLSPRGMSLMKDIFEKCDTLLYQINNVTKTDTHHVAKIHKHFTPHREYVVTIPKVGQDHGSWFGTCTCGFPRKEGCPCNHMVAIIKVGAIPMLTRVSIMPYKGTMAATIPAGH